MTDRPRVAPPKMTRDMIEASYVLVSTMPTGTPKRDRELVAAIWEAAFEVMPRANPSGLTKLQQQAHEIIADYIRDHNQSPTFAEISAQIGRNRSDTWKLCQALERRGIIMTQRKKMRSISLLVQPGEPIPVKMPWKRSPYQTERQMHNAIQRERDKAKNRPRAR